MIWIALYESSALLPRSGRSAMLSFHRLTLKTRTFYSTCNRFSGFRWICFVTIRCSPAKMLYVQMTNEFMSHNEKSHSEFESILMHFLSTNCLCLANKVNGQRKHTLNSTSWSVKKISQFITETITFYWSIYATLIRRKSQRIKSISWKEPFNAIDAHVA